MKLLTKEICRRLPALYSQDGKGEDAIAQVKFFCPWSIGTWYASEASAHLPGGREVALVDVPEGAEVEIIFFGVAVLQERELGYFALSELQSVRGPGGLGIERDIHWTPRPLKDCR